MRTKLYYYIHILHNSKNKFIFTLSFYLIIVILFTYKIECMVGEINETQIDTSTVALPDENTIVEERRLDFHCDRDSFIALAVGLGGLSLLGVVFVAIYLIDSYV